MNKLAFVSLLLPAAVLAQSGSQTITARVGAILRNGVSDGTQGLYLKQVGGAVLGSQEERYVFDPANATAIVPVLYAFEGVRIGELALDTPIPRYTNPASGCPNPPAGGGTEPLSTALREMMWHSDNARLHAFQSAFGRARIDAFSRALGLPAMTQPQIPGCQTPGRGALVEFASIWERIATGALPTTARSSFLPLLPGKAQALAESADYEHIWDVEIPKIMREEAPSTISQAQLTQYQSSMDLAYKSGVDVRCRQAECREVVEDRSIAGWFKVPYCSGGQTLSREFVFGAFISGALDIEWTAGKKTAAETAFAAAKAELLREQIRDGIASCHGTEAVMVTPAPGSRLASRTAIFTWSAAANALGYRLDVGTTFGGSEVITAVTTATNLVVTNLPCNGAPVYARLWTRLDQYVNPKNYVFQACSNNGPVITSPTPGSALTSSVNFTWNPVTGADLYRLSVGSSLGGNDIAVATPNTNSILIANIPTDGRIVFVRIDAHTEAGYSAASDFAFNTTAKVTPAVSAIVNAVTQRPNLSPACLAVVNGANFSSDTTVTVGGTRAQVVGVPTPTQITFVIPGNLRAGTHSTVLSSGGTSSTAFPLVLTDTSPALYDPLLDESGAPIPVARTFKTGDTVVARAIGLGPLGADGRPALPARVSVGGVAATVLSTTSSPSSPGIVQIAFRIPSPMSSGQQRVVVTAGSETSNAVQLLIAGPAISGMVNGASFAGTKVAPGSLVSIFGSDLATEDGIGIFPSALLPGTGVVTVNGVTAPLFDVVASAGQINLLVPFETPTDGNVPVVIANPLGRSSAFQLAMAPAAPGIFRLYDPAAPKRVNAAALIANTAWRVVPSSMAAAIGIPQDCRANRAPAAALCGEPAASGDAIQVYVTGLGRATPNGNPVGNTLRTGDVAPANGSTLYRTVETPRVTIGGIDAPVAFSGIAPGFAGLYQVNVTVPGGITPGDDVPITITIGGASDTATIAIR